MDEVFEPDAIDVQVDDFVKTKSVSRCKNGFLNVLCEDNDDEPVEVDDEKNTEESSDEYEIVYSIHNLKVKWNVMKPVIGERYESRHETEICLTNYSIYKGYKICFKKCDSARLVVKKMNDRHTCVRNYSSSRLMNPTWLAKQFVKELLRKPKLKCKEIQAIIQSKFHCKVSWSKCYRSRCMALSFIDGKLSDHYEIVWDYGHEMMRSNPGSIVRIFVNINPNQTTTFHRMYVCFKATKDGWKIECAVVEVENKVNWKWFLEPVSEDLSLDVGRGLCAISDQYKGLVEATKEILPHIEHRQCARHIYANFRKVYSRIQLINMLWATVKSTTKCDFKINMDRIKTLSEGAYDHLMAREPHTWCRAFFGSDLAYESVENGMVECFNAVIVDAIKKPLLAMLEEIRLLHDGKVLQLKK
uniref:MULE transposase domain-containing protein n=1 Tax=Lactuca sativa TaxID=4236 RepID=A0A9R1X3Y6_LACSA|nr:hypothetical protein LSAT_V11C600299070 [Lactuca sativa]